MSGPRRERPADHVQALMCGLRILECVYHAEGPVAVREVAEDLELNVSTAHHLVNTLVWEGYLVRGADRRLTPGCGPPSAVRARTARPRSGGRSAAPRMRWMMSLC
jgi:DNA-binding IclR family transcriptional regulator